MNQGKTALALSLMLVAGSAWAAGPECANWQTSHPDWLWCDDFEVDNLNSNYFDRDRASGRMSISSADAYGGTSSLRHHYDAGTVSAGYLWRAFGNNPMTSTGSTAKFDEIFWRLFYKMETGWQGNPQKVTRATSFWRNDWSQVFMAHVWQSDDGSRPNMVAIDPVSCVSGSTPVCVGYNDFAHMHWLGAKAGVTPIYSSAQVGQWRCLEVHVKLNTPGQSNGVQEVWIDGASDTARSDLNLRGSYTDYGINAIQLEAYWNSGSPRAQNRYMDNFVISQSRVGCGAPSSDTLAPAAPQNVRVM